MRRSLCFAWLTLNLSLSRFPPANGEPVDSDGVDTPECDAAHMLFVNRFMPALFAGVRRVDGQSLALLKIGDEIFVQPVDEFTARNLKRMALGQHIVVKARGVLKAKGRRR